MVITGRLIPRVWAHLREEEGAASSVLLRTGSETGGAVAFAAAAAAAAAAGLETAAGDSDAPATEASRANACTDYNADELATPRVRDVVRDVRRSCAADAIDTRTRDTATGS